MEKRKYTYNKEFTLENGYTFTNGIEISYHISKEYKISNNDKNKAVIWITHALTANSNPCEWWNTIVGEGKILDPRKYTIICSNVIGSCYGTTGASSYNALTNRPYMLDFPKTTIRDIVAAHEILRKALEIEKIDLLIGGTVGGFQAIEWGIINRTSIRKIVLIATNAKMSPWAIAFSESQRMALYTDKSFVQQNYIKQKQEYIITSGKNGLATARSIALISYRSYYCYNKMQQDEDKNVLFNHRVSSYQRYQGEKLVKRFCPYSYLSMLNLSDSHNIGRDRGGVEKALQLLKAHIICIGIDSDYLFPPQELKDISSYITNSQYYQISSIYGHDGFLLEHEQLNKILKNYIPNN